MRLRNCGIDTIRSDMRCWGQVLEAISAYLHGAKWNFGLTWARSGPRIISGHGGESVPG
jgi:hypothetical protein